MKHRPEPEYHHNERLYWVVENELNQRRVIEGSFKDIAKMPTVLYIEPFPFEDKEEAEEYIRRVESHFDDIHYTPPDDAWREWLEGGETNG